MANDSKPRALQDAEDRIDRSTATPEHLPKYAERSDHQGDTDALEREGRRESDQSWAGPGVAVSTDAQWKGLLIGSSAGGVIGFLLFLPLALIELGGLSTTGRIVLVGLVGALCGGTAGALYMGGRLPELEDETVDGDGRPSRGSTPRDPSTDSRGR